MRIRWIGLVAMGVVLAVAAGARAQSCDDFDPCTNNDMCSDGVCMGTMATGGSCDDFNDCTVNDHCSLEGCTGDPAPINTTCGGGCGKCGQLAPVPGLPLQCLGDVADNGKSCTFSVNDPCFTSSCLITGVPGFPAVAICVPAPKECPDDGNCRGACNPQTGNCDNSLSRCFGECERCEAGTCVAANQGAACDDFNDCTAQSRCESLDLGGRLRGFCMPGVPSGDTPTPTATELVSTPTATVQVTATAPPTSTRTQGTPPTPAKCVGDCNSDGTIAVNELISGVNIALGNADISSCPSFDTNDDDTVAVNELISGVNGLLNGCAA